MKRYTYGQLPANKPSVFRLFRMIAIFTGMGFLPLTVTGIGNPAVKNPGQLSFNRLTRENGLPSNTVLCAIQDFQGYIWIGTTNGLARYDGHDMKIFRSVPGDTASLVDNTIYTLYQASDSMIWIGTDNGLSIYNPHTRRLGNFPFDVKNRGGFPVRRINSFFEAGKGSVWIATVNGIVHAASNGRQFRQIKINSCNQPQQREYYYNAVTAILSDPRDPRAFLLGTSMGLVRFDTVSKVIDRYYNGPPGVDLIISEMFLGSKGLLWACGWGVGVGCFDLKTEQWRIYTPASWGITILHMIPRSKDEFWLATDDMGLGVFNKKSHAFCFYKHDPKNPRSLSSDHILGVAYFNDHQDLWTWGDGIDIENKDYCSFQQVRVPYKFIWISDFFKDQETGKLFIGAYQCKGVPVLDTRKNLWSLVQFDQPLPREGLSVNQFYQDSQGRLWVSTRSNLCYYDRAANLLRIYRTPDGKPLQLSELPVVYGMNEDHEGNLWVGTRLDGIIRIDKTRKKADYFKHIPGDPGSLLEGTHFLAIQTDNLNRVWMGCRFGISIYDPVKNIFDNSLMDTLQKYGIQKKWVNGLEKDSLGRMWIAIDFAGLVRVDVHAGGSFGVKLFHSGNGMNDPGTAWIARDPDAGLWVINNGLLYVDPYRERFQVIDNQNGLHENPGGSGKIYIDHSGNIYLGDSLGFETKNVKNLRYTGKASLNLVFEAMEINGKASPERFYNGTPVAISLTADQNNLTFHYTAISYHHTGQIYYRYKLLGYDKEWVAAETSREGRYTNLPPGKYTFFVSATQGDGWENCLESIQIIINPFFWQTWWFFLLCILALVALVAFVYNYRIKQMLKVERLRTRIATDLHDDVSSTLSSISILSDIVGGQPVNLKSAGMIGEIGSSAREMLERIDDIIWTVTPANDKFRDLGLRIREYAIPLFESKNIRFNFDFPEKLATLRLQMEARRNLYLIAKEAVNNLIKYAQCENAWISFREESGCLILVIRDDGIGFDPAKPTSRNGVKNMRKRAGLAGGSLTIQSRPGAGTQITVKMRFI